MGPRVRPPTPFHVDQPATRRQGQFNQFITPQNKATLNTTFDSISFF